MRRPAFAALAVALLLLARGASADTLSARFPDLVIEIQKRLTQLALPPLSRLQKQQKSACTRAQKPLATATDDLARLLVNERTLVATLDPSFKNDATVAGMLDGILTSAQFDVSERNAFVGGRANALPVSSLRKRALALVAATNRDMTYAGDPKRSRASRMAFFSKALAADVAADKSIRKALLTSGVVVDQMEFYADARYLFATMGTSSNISATYDSVNDKLMLAGGFESMGARRDLQVRIDGPGVGDHDVVVAPDSYFHDNSGVYPATGGKLHVTTWDPANHKAAGTFEIVFSNGTTTVNVTKGAFSFIGLQTQ